ncbi:MAG: hypothetical protein KGH49_04030, partial [Candidatus Micrarchaeota archaeon]|nr:hypothetical protein [Candidatus Micrarchaeota archaeon]
LIVASEWKRNATNELKKSRDTSKVIAAMREAGVNPEKAAGYIGKLAKEMNKLHEIGIGEEEEYTLLKDSGSYLGEVLGTEIEIQKEGESKSTRAERAVPMKPSIEIFF